MRIGIGYDIHRFEKETIKDFIMLGGVKIPYERGIEAHSDGDVCLHAIADALLGSVALGDIGQHFPDTDVQFHNYDSRCLLREVYKKVKVQGYVVGNVDATIIAQKPRLAPHILSMREMIAQDLEVGLAQISIKATTNEGLDAIGQKEGIAVHAVVLVRSI